MTALRWLDILLAMDAMRNKCAVVGADWQSARLLMALERALSGSGSDVFWWAFVGNVAGFSRRHGDDVRSREELHFLMSEE